MPDGVTGVDVENVTMTNSPSSLNINFAHDDLRFDSETERKEWQSREIRAISVAIAGNKRYGTTGLVDQVTALRLWLIILTLLFLLLFFAILYQGMQIHAILQQLASMAR